MVTLNFLANAGSVGSDLGGDSYPFPYINRINGNDAYNRRDLNSATLTPPLPEAFPKNSSFAGNGTEQDAFAEFLQKFHTNAPFAMPDTRVDLDRRIVQGDADSDGDGLSNGEETALFTLGLNPDRASTPSQANAVLRLRRAGQSEVTSAPAQFNLFTSDDITSARLLGRNDVVTNPVPFGLFASPRADFRLDGLILPLSSNAVVTLKLQSSDDMETWSDTAVVPNVEVNLTTPLKFYRFQAN
jgi:hypothetical protein